MSYELNGWKYISIKGTARERGFAHGFLIASDFKKIQEMLEFVSYDNYGYHWDFFIEGGKTTLKNTIMTIFPEQYEEMVGISEGCIAGGTQTTIDEIIAWNNSITLFGSWFPTVSENASGSKEGGCAGLGGTCSTMHGGSGAINTIFKKGGAPDKCSAFIANGDYTEDGKIVVAHNSFSEFIDGQYFYVILDINPTNGHRILMQSAPGWIWSGTDFFVTKAGILGTETTIGGFNKYENNYTIASRIRKAMQYGNTLDDYTRILLDGNSGDYANSWLFGDTNTNEILRIELGLKYYNIERTMNGCFIGFNSTYDPRIRNLECSDTGFDDIRRHQGARKVRLADLMAENKGKLNVKLAQELIADHYDVYLNKENKCSRTVCSHYDLDAREYMSDPSRPKPYAPRGAVDGCVADSTMIQNMSFMGRWGSSCGTPFIASEFLNKNRQWVQLTPYLHDRPSQPWTPFTILAINKFTSKTRKHTYKHSAKYLSKKHPIKYVSSLEKPTTIVNETTYNVLERNPDQVLVE